MIVSDVYSHTAAVFEIDDTTGNIRCKECFEADPHKTEWIRRNSDKRHLTQSLKHSANVTANQKRREAEAARRTEYQSVYSSRAFTSFNTGPSNIAPPSCPTLLGPADGTQADLADNTYHNDTCDPFYGDIPFTDVEPLVRNSEFEQERLRREVELLMADAELADLMGMDKEDTTVTNVEDAFADLGVCDPVDMIPC